MSLLQQIDWVIEPLSNANVDNIDWGAGAEETSGGIDCGDSGEAVDWGDGQTNTDDAGIDWGDDVTDDNEITLDSCGITVEESGQGILRLSTFIFCAGKRLLFRSV